MKEQKDILDDFNILMSLKDKRFYVAQVNEEYEQDKSVK